MLLENHIRSENQDYPLYSQFISAAPNNQHRINDRAVAIIPS